MTDSFRDIEDYPPVEPAVAEPGVERAANVWDPPGISPVKVYTGRDAEQRIERMTSEPIVCDSVVPVCETVTESHPVACELAGIPACLPADQSGRDGQSNCPVATLLTARETTAAPACSTARSGRDVNCAPGTVMTGRSKQACVSARTGRGANCAPGTVLTGNNNQACVSARTGRGALGILLTNNDTQTCGPAATLICEEGKCFMTGEEASNSVNCAPAAHANVNVCPPQTPRNPPTPTHMERFMEDSVLIGDVSLVGSQVCEDSLVGGLKHTTHVNSIPDEVAIPSCSYLIERTNAPPPVSQSPAEPCATPVGNNAVSPTLDEASLNEAFNVFRPQSVALSPIVANLNASCYSSTPIDASSLLKSGGQFGSTICMIDTPPQRRSCLGRLCKRRT